MGGTVPSTGATGGRDRVTAAVLKAATVHTVWPMHNTAAWYCLGQLLTDQQLPFKRAAVTAWCLI